MSLRAIEHMIRRCGIKALSAQFVGDFGLAMHWTWRRDYYAYRRNLMRMH